MDFGAVMGNLATGAGRSMIAGQAYDMRQAQAEDAHALAQMHQMSALSMQQDTADRKAIADETSAASEEFQQSAKTSADVQKLAHAKAGAAIHHNQFEMAKSYGDMAKMAETEQKTALENKAMEVHQKREVVAQSANDYATLPTPENAEKLVRNALEAGVPMQNIPEQGTPQFASWAVGQKTAAMDSGKRIEVMQKEKEFTENQARLKQKQAEDNEAKLERQQATAANQAGLLQIAQQNATTNRLLAQARKDSLEAKTQAALTGTPGKLVKTHPAQVESGIQMIVGSAGEAMNAFENILDMPATTTSSIFADLASGTVPEALTRAGTQALTPDDQKTYNMFTGGVSTEMTRVLTGGGGRSGGQQLAEELKKTLRVEPNDSVQMAMLKNAYGVQMLRNRLHYLATSDDPSFAPLQTELKGKLAKFPSPGALLRQFEKDPKLRAEFGMKGPRLSETMDKVMGAVRARDAETMSGAHEKAPAALPQGWK